MTEPDRSPLHPGISPGFSPRVLIGSLAVFALILVSAGVALRNSQRLTEAAHWVTHTHQSLSALEQLLSSIKDAENSQRGFLLTGDPDYLTPYLATRDSLEPRFSRFRELTRDNPRQQIHLTALHELFRERLAVIDTTIRLEQSGQAVAARRIVTSGRGQQLMEEMTTLVLAMQSEEEALMDRRTEEVAQIRNAATASTVLSAVLALLALWAFVSLLHRHLKSSAESAARLDEQREVLRITISSIGDAVIAGDGEGRVTLLNPVAGHLTGWTPAEAIGQPLDRVFRIVHEETRAPVDNPAYRALRERRVVGIANPTVLISRDGSERPIDDSAAPIRNVGHEVVGVVLVFRDITRRRDEERARIETERNKDHFLAVLAHELRNPLAPLRNAVHLVANPSATPEVVEKAVDIMGRQVALMVRLVDDLLDVSRVSRNRLGIHREPLDLRQVLRAAIEGADVSLRARDHTFTSRMPDSPVMIEGDGARIMQAVQNLLNNAAKFTPIGGRIELSAEVADGAAVVRVRDNGVGIRPEHLEQVFVMFAQLGPSVDHGAGGLGIGLSLVRAIVERHGGRVRACSDGPGQGATFEITLPMAATPGASEDATPRPAMGSAAPRRRILVADDNADARESLALLLEAMGHTVRVARDGIEALGVADELRPDLVYLDIGMPGRNGHEVARALREMEWARRVRIVALTGWGQQEDRQRSHDAGFDVHLTKPVDLAALVASMGEGFGTDGANTDGD